MKKLEKVVPDTSVIINEIISKEIEKKKLKIDELYLHHAMLAELEYQANSGRETGFIGLDEVKKLRELEKKKKFMIKYSGSRPTPGQIRYAKRGGEIDAVIRDLALDMGATLITADKVQAEVGLAMGMEVMFIPYEVKRELKFTKLFKESYMSLHLKEGEAIKAKSGKPGEWNFLTVRKKKLSTEEVEDFATEIIEAARTTKDGYLETEKAGSIIAQIKNYRIVITKPPLSDGWEITIVRPVKKLKIEDYKLSTKLSERISKKAEGTLISGSPGSGKSTFARALALVFTKSEKIVKSLESPRDLDLPAEVTQYSLSKGSPEELRDILLLTRPDYTIFDEMRNVVDFKLYADLRLAGVGMVGIVHGTNPIDSVQRFIGKVELGMIPSIIDTVIFIDKGKVAKILSLEMKVKVPSGMTEADLARPVVEVRDFETGKLEYEMYTYGEQTVVIPVVAEKKTEFDAMLERTISDSIKKKTGLKHLEVEKLGEKSYALYVHEREIPRVIGTRGERIKALEEALGIAIDVRPLIKTEYSYGSLDYKFKEERKYLIFRFRKAVKSARLMINGKFIAEFPLSRKKEIKVVKKSLLGDKILQALDFGKEITFE
jgi:ATPase